MHRTIKRQAALICVGTLFFVGACGPADESEPKKTSADIQQDAVLDAGSISDGAAEDVGSDSSAVDANEPDTTVEDTTVEDTTVEDTTVEDTTVAEDVAEDVVEDVAEDTSGCKLGTEGCACDVDICDAGLVCDATKKECRIPLTCGTAACVKNQLCTTKTDADAVCEPKCVANFVFDKSANKCTACTTQNCLAEPCDPNDANLKVCIDANKGCKEEGGKTVCGGCMTGYKPDSAGKCIFTPDCGKIACKTDEYCSKADPTKPVCMAKPCAGANEAQDTGKKCKDCSNLKCKQIGLTGKVWPYTDASDNCMCETQDAFFLSIGTGATAYACDADKDGWIRTDGALAQGSTDLNRAANARCQLLNVTSVQLEDEYGFSKELVWCGKDVIVEKGKCPTGTKELPMRLMEPDRNDVPRGVNDKDSPKIGATGRQLKPAELNWLTKACAASADYNGDFETDYIETQEGDLKTGTNIPTWTLDQKALHQFSYFVELYTSRFVLSKPGATTGSLHIRAKSRCELNFPLHYDDSIKLTPKQNTFFPYDGPPTDNVYWDTQAMKVSPPDEKDETNTDYWRNCARKRDPSFEGKPSPGMDFARFDCDPKSPKGTCDKPPAHPTIDFEKADMTKTKIRGHGLCNLGYDAGGKPRKPMDGKWRGMQHHSQFKCLQIVQTVQAPKYQVTPSQLDTIDAKDQAGWVWNDCTAINCAQENGSCQSSVGGDLKSMMTPAIQCLVVAKPLSGSVGWAARKFSVYGTAVGGTLGLYQGGCVFEDAEWTFNDGKKSAYSAYQSALCPYPAYSVGTIGTKMAEKQAIAKKSFGRFSCWLDGSNFLWGAENSLAELCWGKVCTAKPSADLGVLR